MQTPEQAVGPLPGGPAHHPAQPPRPGPFSTTAFVGLVFGLLGLGCGVFAILAIVLGLVALSAFRKNATLRGKPLAIIALCVGGIGLVTSTLIVLAFADIFSRTADLARDANVRQEAWLNLRKLGNGVREQYRLPRSPPDTKRLPASIPRTPVQPICGKAPWPSNAPPGWRELGFTPMEPLAFAYEYVVLPDGQSFVLRATGDIDCNGVPEVLEYTGRVEVDDVVLEATPRWIGP